MENETFKTGTKFITGGKRKDECVVTDVLKTYNLANELVDIRYVTQHKFMGQIVINRDTCYTTIARGLVY